MRAVSQFEAKLLRILYTILGRSPVAQVYRWFEEKTDPPSCLSRDTIELIKQALSKGTASILSTAGGWQKERYLRNEEVSEGRLWERTPPKQLGLTFSPATIDFLMWLTSENTKKRAWLSHRKLTMGDQLLQFLTFRALTTTGLIEHWSRQKWARKNGLICLMFAKDFAHPKLTLDPSYDQWVEGIGACIVECFQKELTQSWTEMEQNKATIIAAAEMRQLGRAQALVLDRFLSTAETAERKDLCRFLLAASRQLLPASVHPQRWLPALKVRQLRISERAEIYNQALTFLASLDRLESWQRQATTVGYFDEGYAASQLWLSTWDEFNADEYLKKARRIREALAPL